MTDPTLVTDEHISEALRFFRGAHTTVKPSSVVHIPNSNKKSEEVKMETENEKDTTIKQTNYYRYRAFTFIPETLERDNDAYSLRLNDVYRIVNRISASTRATLQNNPQKAIFIPTIQHTGETATYYCDFFIMARNKIKTDTYRKQVCIIRKSDLEKMQEVELEPSVLYNEKDKIQINNAGFDQHERKLARYSDMIPLFQDAYNKYISNGFILRTKKDTSGLIVCDYVLYHATKIEEKRLFTNMPIFMLNKNSKIIDTYVSKIIDDTNNKKKFDSAKDVVILTRGLETRMKSNIIRDTGDLKNLSLRIKKLKTNIKETEKNCNNINIPIIKDLNRLKKVDVIDDLQIDVKNKAFIFRTKMLYMERSISAARRDNTPVEIPLGHYEIKVLIDDFMDRYALIGKRLEGIVGTCYHPCIKKLPTIANSIRCGGNICMGDEGCELVRDEIRYKTRINYYNIAMYIISVLTSEPFGPYISVGSWYNNMSRTFKSKYLKGLAQKKFIAHTKNINKIFIESKKVLDKHEVK